MFEQPATANAPFDVCVFQFQGPIKSHHMAVEGLNVTQEAHMTTRPHHDALLPIDADEWDESLWSLSFTESEDQSSDVAAPSTISIPSPKVPLNSEE